MVGRFVVAVARREHDAFHADGHDLIEVSADAVRIRSVKECGVGRHAETALDCFLDAFERQIVSAFAADGVVVVLAFAIEMDREGQILRRRELRQPALELKRVGAEIDVRLARDQAVDDFYDLRMQQWLSTGN